MKLKEIHIKGWRSFDNENGIKLQDLKRINIIIGPNNSGKSNIGKYFLFLKELTNKSNFNKDLTEIYAVFNNIDFKVSNKDTWAWLEGNISSHIIVSKNKNNWEKGIPFFPQNNEEVKLIANHLFKKNKSNLSLLIDKERTHVEINEHIQSNYKIINHHVAEPIINGKKVAPNYISFDKNIEGAFDTFYYWYELLNSLIFIDPIRHIDRPSTLNNKNSFYFEGNEIQNELKKNSRS